MMHEAVSPQHTLGTYVFLAHFNNICRQRTAYPDVTITNTPRHTFDVCQPWLTFFIFIFLEATENEIFSELGWISVFPIRIHFQIVKTNFKFSTAKTTFFGEFRYFLTKSWWVILEKNYKFGQNLFVMCNSRCTINNNSFKYNLFTKTQKNIYAIRKCNPNTI